MQCDNLNEAVHGLHESKKELEEKWLTFWLDGQLLGASIINVEQIVGMQPITQVPEYPSYGKGVINLSGNIIPLIDLRLRLGKSETAYTDRTCVIITSMEDRQLGFIVDEVDAVVNILGSQTSQLPKMESEVLNRYLMGVARLTNDCGFETIVLLLDTQKILAENEFSQITLLENFCGETSRIQDAFNNIERCKGIADANSGAIRCKQKRSGGANLL